MNSRLNEILKWFLSVSLGLSLGLVVTWFAGESPLHVLKVLYHGAFGDAYNIGMTMFYSATLLLCGLSVSIAFQAGLFNIGAEGQLEIGAISAAMVGILCKGLSPWIAIPLGVLAAFFGGAFWGSIAGFLKEKRGSHEVIITIMLNFIASGILSYLTLYVFKNPDSQNPETAVVGNGFLFHIFEKFDGAPVSWALALAPSMVFLLAIFFYRTVWGYELRAFGQNPVASKFAGIKPYHLTAMILAGGVAGLCGVIEVMGNMGKYRLDFSPDFGFVGIAVALLGRGRPIGVLVSAVLFGALHKGTSDLDLETENVTRDLSLILQSLVILCVASVGIWDKWDLIRSRLFTKKVGAE